MAGTRTRLTAVAIGGACALLAAAPAQACRIASANTAYIHDRLPSPLPKGLIVALVSFEHVGSSYRKGDRARVQRIIQGDYKGRYLIGRQAWSTSCSAPFANGRKGYVVAAPRGIRDGRLVVHFIEVSRGSGFRLPDGWQLPGTVLKQLRLAPRPRAGEFE